MNSFQTEMDIETYRENSNDINGLHNIFQHKSTHENNTPQYNVTHTHTDDTIHTTNHSATPNRPAPPEPEQTQHNTTPVFHCILQNVHYQKPM